MAAVAVGADGRITGLTHNAQSLLAPDLIGRRFNQIFACEPEDLPALSRALAPVEGMLELQGGGMIFTRAVPPAAAARTGPRAAPSSPLASIHGGDPAMARLAARAAKVLDRKISIVLRGETGTGKEFIARAMHRASRRGGPFVAINCAALPESLIESELFGYAPNAFTGAHARGKKGLIREAHGGTLFLDEIGDMPLTLQARLLRVLSEHEVLPVGALRPEPVDLRVISASHRDLAAEVAAGSFRQDLYYRLNGLVLDVPPVRARADLAWLIGRIAAATEEKVTFTPAAMQLLLAHGWPGNVREIINTCELCAALSDGAPVAPEDLPTDIATPRPVVSAEPALLRLLQECGGNVSAAARRAGIDRSTFYRRMQRVGQG
jgi:transcriptional regulator of acetoin/glycerol metabolism